MWTSSSGRCGPGCTLALSILKLFLALLRGMSLGMSLYKRAVCQPFADATALNTWDIVNVEPQDGGKTP
jgi:hypothetical protein